MREFGYIRPQVMALEINQTKPKQKTQYNLLQVHRSRLAAERRNETSGLPNFFSFWNARNI
jgi:hypothetical protein